MTETTVSTLGVGQVIGFNKLRSDVGADYHLCDTLAVIDCLLDLGVVM